LASVEGYTISRHTNHLEAIREIIIREVILELLGEQR